MTIEQLDNIKTYIGAMSGALFIQQENIMAIERDAPISTSKKEWALKNENLKRARDTNRDMVRYINKLECLVSKVEL